MTREDNERYLARMELLERTKDTGRLMEAEKLDRDRERVAESAARLARERESDEREQPRRKPERGRGAR